MGIPLLVRYRLYIESGRRSMAQLFAGWFQLKYVGNPVRTLDFTLRLYIPGGFILGSQWRQDGGNEKRYDSQMSVDWSGSLWLRGITVRNGPFIEIHDDVIQMENFSALLAICAGNSPVSGESPAHRPVTRSFDVFFYLRLNKWLSKQWWGWWFGTLSHPLWRHCNVTTILCTNQLITPVCAWKVLFLKLDIFLLAGKIDQPWFKFDVLCFNIEYDSSILKPMLSHGRNMHYKIYKM